MYSFCRPDVLTKYWGSVPFEYFKHEEEAKMHEGQAKNEAWSTAKVQKTTRKVSGWGLLFSKKYKEELS